MKSLADSGIAAMWEELGLGLRFGIVRRVKARRAITKGGIDFRFPRRDIALSKEFFPCTSERL
jgi:hypothetical protein